MAIHRVGVLLARQPAGDRAVDDDGEARLGPQELLAVGLLGLRAPPARDLGLGEDGQEVVEVVLDQRAQDQPLPRSVGRSMRSVSRTPF